SCRKQGRGGGKGRKAATMQENQLQAVHVVNGRDNPDRGSCFIHRFDGDRICCCKRLDYRRRPKLSLLFSAHLPCLPGLKVCGSRRKWAFTERRKCGNPGHGGSRGHQATAFRKSFCVM